MALCTTAYAEPRAIGIKITSEKNHILSVDIFSDVKSLNRRNLSIDDTVKVLSNELTIREGVVGIVARDIMLSKYLPILKCISENPSLDLGFIDGSNMDIVVTNIKKKIEQGAAANP